ncbi:MAG: hypothetical protein BGN89_04105 [Alphaproteobacteria bacterium 64-6]|nr:MAG: hypothetical protein BGN89_04105 [Alphaproteobacteria bacterium 64-6]
MTAFSLAASSLPSEDSMAVRRGGSSSRSTNWSTTIVSSLSMRIERPLHTDLPCRAQVEQE